MEGRSFATKRVALLLSFIVACVFLFFVVRPPMPSFERPKTQGKFIIKPETKSVPKSIPKSIPYTPKPLPDNKLCSPSQIHQKQRVQDYCKLLLSEEITGGLFSQTTKVDTQNGHPIYAYKSGDIVSEHLIRGGWEQREFMALLKSAEKWATKKGFKNEEVIFVDIGANLGVYTLGFAEKGFSVISFEAGLVNNILINRVLCDVPEFQERITLYDFGLGHEESICSFFSHDINKADGHLHCSTDFDEVWKPPAGYIVRDVVKVFRLDDVINDPAVLSKIGAVKMDTEGYEALIVEGGKNFFNSKIPYIFSEAQPGMTTEKGGNLLEYWKTMKDAGYFATCERTGGVKEIDPAAFVAAGHYDCLLIHESVKE